MKILLIIAVVIYTIFVIMDAFIEWDDVDD